MRIAAGDKSYSRKIDEILFGHPKIQEAWAIAISNPCRGETVKAFVVLKPEAAATEREILDFCKQNLAPYKVPRQVEIRPELPKSSTGKILHRELRKA